MQRVHRGRRNVKAIILILCFALFMLFTAGCSDIATNGHTNITTASWILKTDANGKLEWTTTIDNPDLFLAAIIQVHDGGYAIAGTRGPGSSGSVVTSGSTIYATTGPATGPTPCIVTLDAEGEIISEMTIGASPDSGNSLVEAPGGGFVLARNSGVLTRVSENGTVLWSTTVGAESEQSPGWTVVRAPGGGYVVAGNNRSVRLDEEGTIVWERAFAPDHTISTIITTPTGDFVTAGTCDAGVWTAQLDPEGNDVWNRTLTADARAGIHTVRLSMDGTYDLIYGITPYMTGSGPADERWVTQTTEVSLSADGGLIREKQVHFSQDIVATEDGGYVYAGFPHNKLPELHSSGSPGSPLHVVMIDNEGKIGWDASFSLEGDQQHVGSIIQTRDGGFVIFGDAVYY